VLSSKPIRQKDFPELGFVFSNLACVARWNATMRLSDPATPILRPNESLTQLAVAKFQTNKTKALPRSWLRFFKSPDDVSP
jgi:hypothetical protein